MKSNTIEKKGDFVLHQLKFKADVMMAANDILSDENRVHKLIFRKEKKFLKSFLPELVEDGIKFRNGKVFTPEHLLNDLVRDDKWIALKAKAESAIEKMRLYEKAIEEKQNLKNKK